MPIANLQSALELIKPPEDLEKHQVRATPQLKCYHCFQLWSFVRSCESSLAFGEAQQVINKLSEATRKETLAIEAEAFPGVQDFTWILNLEASGLSLHGESWGSRWGHSIPVPKPAKASQSCISDEIWPSRHIFCDSYWCAGGKISSVWQYAFFRTAEWVIISLEIHNFPETNVEGHFTLEESERR